MRFGKLLEPVLRAAYEEDTGKRVNAPGDRTYWAKDGIRYAHLDGIIVPEGIWEGKVPFQTFRNWQQGPPVYVLAQVQHYLDIAGEPWCDVSALAAGLDPIFQSFRVDADEHTQDNIRKALLRFWNENVLTGIPPEDLPLNIEYPAHKSDLMVVADEDAETIVAQLWSTKLEGKQAEATEEDLKDALKAKIGTAAGMVGNGWRVRWKKNRDSEKVEWRLVADVYRKQLEQIRDTLETAPMVEQSEQVLADLLHVLTDGPDTDTVVSLYTTVQPGARPFVLEEVKNK